MTRVLFHPAPTPDWLKDLQVEILGLGPKGTWLAADDSVALELLKRDKTTVALYPTLADYHEAMEGLKGKEGTEAVTLRLALVEGNPETNSVPDFFLPEREGLEAVAIAAATPGAGNALHALFRAQLDVLLNINGPDAYRGQDKISLLSGAFDGLNKLNWEEEALRRNPDITLPPLDTSLEKSRKELALEIQRGERSLGVKYDQEPTGSVSDRLERGIFARPFDRKLVQGMAEEQEPVHKWKDGFVSIWGEYALQNLPMADKKKTILYLDAGQCHADFMSSTPSQLSRKFEKQSRIPLTAQAAAYLAQLRLTVVLELLGRQTLVAKFNAALAERFGRHAEMELDRLKFFLAAKKPWRQARSGSATRLSAKLAESLPETAFWKAWSEAKGWTFQQSRMGWIADAKAKVLVRIPK